MRSTFPFTLLALSLAPALANAGPVEGPMVDLATIELPAKYAGRGVDVSVFRKSEIPSSTQGVPGMSFMSNVEEEVLTTGDCHKLIEELQFEVESEFKSAGFYVEFTAMCIGGGKSAFILHNFIVEPFEASTTGAFLKLVDRVSTKPLYTKLAFERGESVRNAGEVSVTKSHQAPKPIWKEKHTDTYSSYLAMKVGMDKEYQLMRAPDFADLRELLVAYISEPKVQELERVLEGQLILNTINWPILETATHEVRSSVGTGVFRDCSEPGFSCKL